MGLGLSFAMSSPPRSLPLVTNTGLRSLRLGSGQNLLKKPKPVTVHDAADIF